MTCFSKSLKAFRVRARYNRRLTPRIRSKQPIKYVQMQMDALKKLSWWELSYHRKLLTFWHLKYFWSRRGLANWFWAISGAKWSIKSIMSGFSKPWRQGHEEGIRSWRDLSSLGWTFMSQVCSVILNRLLKTIWRKSISHGPRSNTPFSPILVRHSWIQDA